MPDRNRDGDNAWSEGGNAMDLADPVDPGPEARPGVIDPAVRCDDCTACCCRKEVWLLGDNRVPGHLVVNDAWGGEVLERLDDGWCAALDRQTLRCSIYAYRPQVCRDVVMGGWECCEARAQPLGD
jgi:hypothetical protein